MKNLLKDLQIKTELKVIGLWLCFLIILISEHITDSIYQAIILGVATLAATAISLSFITPRK